MTGQNDRQDRSLTGQVRDQAGHCPLTGRYLQPCTHRFKLNSFKGVSYSKAALLVVIHILLRDFCCVSFQQTLEEASLANVDITCGAVAWLLFHVALHKDVQKNLTVEVKNSISRGVCKYFSEYFFFC